MLYGKQTIKWRNTSKWNNYMFWDCSNSWSKILYVFRDITHCLWGEKEEHEIKQWLILPFGEPDVLWVQWWKTQRWSLPSRSSSLHSFTPMPNALDLTPWTVHTSWVSFLQTQWLWSPLIQSQSLQISPTCSQSQPEQSPRSLLASRGDSSPWVPWGFAEIVSQDPAQCLVQ